MPITHLKIETWRPTGIRWKSSSHKPPLWVFLWETLVFRSLFLLFLARHSKIAALTPNCSLQAYHSSRVKIVKQRLRLGPETFNQIQTCLWAVCQDHVSSSVFANLSFSLFLVWKLLSLQSPALGVILLGLSLWSDWNRNNTLPVASACTVSSAILNALWITAYHCHCRQHPYFTDENGWVFPHWHTASKWRRLSTREVHGTTGLHCTSWSFIEEMGGLWVKAY